MNILVPALLYAVLIAYLKMQQFMCYHFPMYKSTLKGTKKKLELIDKSQLCIEITCHKKLFTSVYLAVISS